MPALSGVAQPDLLLVGMGMPRQEHWIARHGPRAGVAVGLLLVGVGSGGLKANVTSLVGGGTAAGTLFVMVSNTIGATTTETSATSRPQPK